MQLTMFGDISAAMMLSICSTSFLACTLHSVSLPPFLSVCPTLLPPVLIFEHQVCPLIKHSLCLHYAFIMFNMPSLHLVHLSEASVRGSQYCLLHTIRIEHCHTHCSGGMRSTLQTGALINQLLPRRILPRLQLRRLMQSDPDTHTSTLRECDIIITSTSMHECCILIIASLHYCSLHHSSLTTALLHHSSLRNDLHILLTTMFQTPTNKLVTVGSSPCTY